MKSFANEIFGIFENYNAGKCSYDRALEDASKILDEYANTRPIRGYITTGRVAKILYNIYDKKKVSETESFNFDVKVHRNDMEDIERILAIKQ